MEVFFDEVDQKGFFFFIRTDHPASTLGYSCSSGNFYDVGSAPDLSESAICLGMVKCVVGRFRVTSSSPWYLIAVTETKSVCHLPPPIDADVVLISNVTILRLEVPETAAAFNFSEFLPSPNQTRRNSGRGARFGAGAIGREFFSAQERRNQNVISIVKKMFTDSSHPAFFYIPDGDITYTYQRFCQKMEGKNLDQVSSSNDYFFWNSSLLEGIENPLFRQTIIQGFCAEEVLCLSDEDVTQKSDVPDFMRQNYKLKEPRQTRVYLISRRCRHRVGRRYKRRGIDDEGHVANFVETETVFYNENSGFVSSIVQIRGSIPVYWSQEIVGTEYRPEPKLLRSETDNRQAFRMHFERMAAMYEGKIACINLVNQNNHEKIMWDAFGNAILDYDSPNLYYVSLDFHAQAKQTKDMQFTLNYLMDATATVREEMGVCWCDKDGGIEYQRGVFRVNCMDCLDRTNVVMCAISMKILTKLLEKTGALLPEDNIPLSVHTRMKELWLRNGNEISKQYAGTDALKGDVTRTGQRQMSGRLKDGVNSCERYLTNQFRDTMKQAAIDILTTGYSYEFDESLPKQLINGAKTILEKNELLIKSYVVSHVEANLFIQDSQVTSQLNPYQVLLITKNNFYLVYPSRDFEKVAKFYKVPIRDLDIIEFGKLQSKPTTCGIRLHYIHDNSFGHFFTLVPYMDEELVTSEAQDSYAPQREVVIEMMKSFADAKSALSLDTKVKSPECELADLVPKVHMALEKSFFGDFKKKLSSNFAVSDNNRLRQSITSNTSSLTSHLTAHSSQAIRGIKSNTSSVTGFFRRNASHNNVVQLAPDATDDDGFMEVEKEELKDFDASQEEFTQVSVPVDEVGRARSSEAISEDWSMETNEDHLEITSATDSLLPNGSTSPSTNGSANGSTRKSSANKAIHYRLQGKECRTQVLLL